ncbi:MAG TPA: glucose 1-dehydrogenase [Gemmatimonadaceae bacterium]|jgi:threonine dehydrogenase-like Zn-dependent dehydrogenase
MNSTRAITVEPGVADSLQLEEFRPPRPELGAVLIRAIALGICGTDRDIIDAKYGAPPSGHKRLILGHESLGRIEEAPADSGLRKGQLVMGVVRHPDPVPCPSCAAGEWDMCRNDQFTEHGIKQLDGFGSELYRLDPEFVIPLDESLGIFGVLVEPTSVVAKAWQQIDRIGKRSKWEPHKVLITGAGPVGLLGALLSKQRGLDVHVYDHNDKGIKPALSKDLGVSYHSSGLESLPKDFDVILECTAVSEVIVEVVKHSAPDGIVCLLGVSAAGDSKSVDIGKLNLDVVLGNRVIFGSVNANRSHYEAAAAALAKADRGWLDRLITRRVPLSDWKTAFEKGHDDVKTIILFESDAASS